MSIISNLLCIGHLIITHCYSLMSKSIFIYFAGVPLLNRSLHPLAFLKQIRQRYPDMEIIILLDGGPSHGANILKEYVIQDKKIHLEPLPKYAPKLNIQEDIWKWLRKRITHNFLFDAQRH